MGELIDDEMLDAFAIVAEPEEVAAALAQRYGDVVTRISLALPTAAIPTAGAVITAIQAI